MGTVRVLITPTGGEPRIREVLDGPELDHLDVSDVLGLVGGEQIKLLPCVKIESEPLRTVEIRDLEELQ